MHRLNCNCAHVYARGRKGKRERDGGGDDRLLKCVIFLSFLTACLSPSNGNSMSRELVLRLDLFNCPCHRGLIQQDPVFPAGQPCVCVCVWWNTTWVMMLSVQVALFLSPHPHPTHTCIQVPQRTPFIINIHRRKDRKRLEERQHRWIRNILGLIQAKAHKSPLLQSRTHKHLHQCSLRLPGQVMKCTLGWWGGGWRRGRYKNPLYDICQRRYVALCWQMGTAFLGLGPCQSTARRWRGVATERLTGISWHLCA